MINYIAEILGADGSILQDNVLQNIDDARQWVRGTLRRAPAGCTGRITKNELIASENFWDDPDPVRELLETIQQG